VNSLAQAVGTEALKDIAYQVKTRETCHTLRLELETELQQIPQLKVFSSTANYLFVKIIGKGDAEALAYYCLNQGIMI
jgi:histidinol-phosphate/aromatic aminotransferase/cobyric acid decarboxylase-like protein